MEGYVAEHAHKNVYASAYVYRNSDYVVHFFERCVWHCLVNFKQLSVIK